jgi:cytochrome c553
MNVRSAPVWALLLALPYATLPAHAADAAQIAAGREKARMCATCHGSEGISSAPDAPNLAGQPEIYLAKELRAYRSGARRHEVMAVVAKPLSDADIDALAGWFASLKVQPAH